MRALLDVNVLIALLDADHVHHDAARMWLKEHMARHHQFWPDSVSLIRPSVLKPEQAITSKQITDLYLLALAVSRGGRLVTFDVRISSASVVGADHRHLCAIHDG